MSYTCHHHSESVSHSCLSSVPIFAGLKEDEIALLHPLMRTTQFKKGEPVFHEGEHSASLFVLNRGIIKLTKLENNGKEHILRLLFPGDFFGQSALLQEKPHYASAYAVEETRICLIHRNDFLNVLRSNPDTAAGFMAALSGQLEEADGWAAVLTLLEADRRLARMLLYFRDKSAPGTAQFKLPVSKKELAGMVGTTPETLSRKLAQMSIDGILSVSQRTLHIHDEPALRQLAGEGET